MDLSTVDHLLTTTRCVRKRLDFSGKVEPAIIERCIEIAIQAPTGGNAQNFNFVVVMEADKRAAIRPGQVLPGKPGTPSIPVAIR